MLLVSMDGFRWDYLTKHNLSNFNYLKSIGSHADYINNSFSTVTFPNHWTIVTGLYEETHGIMQNNMYDPALNQTFDFASEKSQTKDWFGQNKATEPIWYTNQKNGHGRRSAAEWVGSHIQFGQEQVLNIPYNHSTPFNALIDQFIRLFTSNREEEEPINFGALYFDEPDHTGHLYGPYSPQMAAKLQEMDQTLGYLIAQLKEHHLFDKLNLIVTSDHGMEQISEETVIFLDKHIDTNLFSAYGSRACWSIFVKKQTDYAFVYKTLKSIANIDVYKKADIPNNLHYKLNVRIGDFLIITKIGHSVYVNTIQIDWKLTNGDHGYYNNESSMLPIFISHGPNFKSNFTIQPFNNVDIYPLMCFLLDVQPAVNNGTLENVIDMVSTRVIEKRFNLAFILLTLIPIGMIASTAFCLCIMNDGRDNAAPPSHSFNNGYSTLLNSDDNAVLPQSVDDSDDEESNLGMDLRRN
jgi:ectonucleotide pyrophosphatase/phosphodiesterase family protein 5